MAQRTINADFVDFNGHKYEPGEEDALALVLPKRDVEIFMEKGILKGDWLNPEVRELPAVADLPDYLADLGRSRKCGRCNSVTLGRVPRSTTKSGSPNSTSRRFITLCRIPPLPKD
jgi:hypothetical protein